MIILYVPFTRAQSGDLTNLVQCWQTNYKKAINNCIRIIYHQDEIDYDDIGRRSELYICAHGYSEWSFVGNNVDVFKADVLSPQKLAERFNQDIVPIADKIQALHLYCCGSENKNMNIATELMHNILLAESPLYFYSGLLWGADDKGKLWSMDLGRRVPVEDTAVELSFCFPESDEQTKSYRIPCKQQHLEKWYEKMRNNRRFAFFEKVIEERLDRLQKFRTKVMEVIQERPSLEPKAEMSMIKG